MSIREAVIDAIRHQTNLFQGNYTVLNSPEKTDVYYYGHKVFTASGRKFKYDFCGYEGYPRTTKIINFCLEAVNAPYRVKTENSEVKEVAV